MEDIRKQWKTDYRHMRKYYNRVKHLFNVFMLTDEQIDTITNFQMDIKEIANKYHVSFFQLVKCIGGKE